MTTELEIAANRRWRKYPRRIQALRVLWGCGQLVFRIVPRPFHGMRVALLRLFGARVGRHVQIHNTVRIVMPWNLRVGDWSAIGDEVLIYNLGVVEIGRKTTISHRAHLCAGTHDYTQPSLPLLWLPIHIGDQAWVCAQAFVGPGVTVGEGAVVAAGAVAVRDVDPWMVVAGNPAKPLKERRLVDSGGASS